MKKLILNLIIFSSALVFCICFDTRKLCEGMQHYGGDYTVHEITECKLLGIEINY